jgi:hypothetical protein
MDSSTQNPTMGDPGGTVGTAVVETGAGVTGAVVQPLATSARMIKPQAIRERAFIPHHLALML